MDVSMHLVSCSFREDVNDSPSDRPKLWVICLEGSVLSQPTTWCYRSCLGTLESCIVMSYRWTDYWSIFNTCRSSMHFSHNLRQPFNSTCKIVIWLTAYLNDYNTCLCLTSIHGLLWATSINNNKINTLKTKSFTSWRCDAANFFECMLKG